MGPFGSSVGTGVGVEVCEGVEGEGDIEGNFADTSEVFGKTVRRKIAPATINSITINVTKALVFCQSEARI
jgi:hypothetical protein